MKRPTDGPVGGACVAAAGLEYTRLELDGVSDGSSPGSWDFVREGRRQSARSFKQFLLFESYSCADRAALSVVHDASCITAALLFRETEWLTFFLDQARSSISSVYCSQQLSSQGRAGSHALLAPGAQKPWNRTSGVKSVSKMGSGLMRPERAARSAFV